MNNLLVCLQLKETKKAHKNIFIEGFPNENQCKTNMFCMVSFVILGYFIWQHIPIPSINAYSILWLLQASSVHQA